MIYLTIGILLSAILYRMGGMEGLDTKFRDFGCPAVFLIVLALTGHWTWWALPSAIALFAALTTYWDSVFGEDNLYAHGVVCGISMVALCFAGVHWWAVAIYSAVLCLVMGSLNTICTRRTVRYSDWIEECARGAVIILALPLLLIR